MRGVLWGLSQVCTEGHPHNTHTHTSKHPGSRKLASVYRSCAHRRANTCMHTHRLTPRRRSTGTRRPSQAGHGTAGKCPGEARSCCDCDAETVPSLHHGRPRREKAGSRIPLLLEFLVSPLPGGSCPAGAGSPDLTVHRSVTGSFLPFSSM